MNILLLNTFGLESSCERNILFETEITGAFPPLGLGYVGNALQEKGYPVLLLDNKIEKLSADKLVQRLRTIKPDIVLLSGTTFSWPAVRIAASFVKNVCPSCRVGVGGPHLSLYPEKAIADEAIDFGVYGEGEKTIVEVAGAIASGRPFDDIKGLVYKKNGVIIVNDRRGVIEDLDAVGFPRPELYNYKKYRVVSVRNPFFPIVTSRGCPFHCTFCYQGYSAPYRERSPENVVEELECLVNNYGIREIVFFDDTFAVNTQRAIQICEGIIKKNLKFRWDIRTRVGLLTKELLTALKKAGCYRLNIGIESGNDHILEKMNKGCTVGDVVRVCRLAKKYDFDLRGYFILGFPGESLADMKRTIDFARRLPLDWASFTNMVGAPGARVYIEALDSGYFPDDFWDTYAHGKIGTMDKQLPYFIPEHMSLEALIRLRWTAYAKFYLRPGTIAGLINKDNVVSAASNLFRLGRVIR